jgi:membrane protein DedA with SNARE-associated domain
MTFYFRGLIDFVGSHPHFAFIAVFLLALSEAIPVIGTVVPGSTLILGISALATTADVKPWPLLVAAVVGAITGDGLSFWLGHQYHREILQGWPLNRFPGAIHRSAQFISRYGVASVFLARFTAVVRAFVPLLAGTFAALLRGQYPVSTGVGADPYFSWCIGRYGNQLRRHSRRATRPPANRCTDFSINCLELSQTSVTSQIGVGASAQSCGLRHRKSAFETMSKSAIESVTNDTPMVAEIRPRGDRSGAFLRLMQYERVGSRTVSARRFCS